MCPWGMLPLCWWFRYVRYEMDLGRGMSGLQMCGLAAVSEWALFIMVVNIMMDGS
jgi:hypothetical protein